MAFPFLDEESHRKLDSELLELLRQFSGSDSIPYSDLTSSVVGIIDRMTGKLIRQGWQETWQTSGYLTWGWFGNVEGDKEARALFEAFTEMARFALDAPTLYHQEQQRGHVRSALAGYLALRGKPVADILRSPESSAHLPLPPVDDEDLAILRVLRRKGPKLLTLDVIATDARREDTGPKRSRISRKTVGFRVRRLIDSELVERPKGPRSGVAITGKGRELLDASGSR